jgi:hypothetical protein
MAITRTQIAKQLLANGGRIGFRVGGGRGGTGYGRGARTSEERADTGMARGRGPGGTIGKGPTGVSLHGGDKPNPLVKQAKDIQQTLMDEPIKFPDKFADSPTISGFLLRKSKPFFEAGSRRSKEFFLKNVYTGSKNVVDAYNEYMLKRQLGETDALGNPIKKSGEAENIIPIIPQTTMGGGGELAELEPEEQEPFELARAFKAEGGIMDGNIDEMGRQMYGLGKLVKKVTRGIKKIVKSPIGKAALLGLGAKGIMGGTGISKFLLGAKGIPGVPGQIGKYATPGLLGKLGLTKGFGSYMPTALGGIGLASLASGLMTKQTEEDEEDELYRGEGLDFASLRPYGIQRFAEGGKPEPVAKKTMPLLNMGGMEKDYREDGGFVPIGRMEKADDVPARLSKNEFVFTADAVRNAGDGNVDKGAEVMYNMMKNLESGGDVSKESQGLKGARKMFQTSQRLEEVL